MRSVERAIERHYVDLRRYARTLSKGRMDAEDLLQDCLVRALSRPLLWDGIQNPRAYLLTILHNTYVDSVLARHRRGEHISLDAIEMHSAYPAVQMASLELNDLVRLVDYLPPEQRRALICVCFDGLSYREAAGHLRIPLGTLMSRISRARRALHRIVDGR